MSSAAATVSCIQVNKDKFYNNGLVYVNLIWNFMLDNTQPGIVICVVWHNRWLVAVWLFWFYCAKQSPFCRAMSVSACQACTIKSKQTDRDKSTIWRLSSLVYDVWKLCVFSIFFGLKTIQKIDSSCLKVFFYSKQQNFRSAKKWFSNKYR